MNYKYKSLYISAKQKWKNLFFPKYSRTFNLAVFTISKLNLKFLAFLEKKQRDGIEKEKERERERERERRLHIDLSLWIYH